jgi:hypothetical protein
LIGRLQNGYNRCRAGRDKNGREANLAAGDVEGLPWASIEITFKEISW